jgi:CubicO group peptidase (beta-lactamase class C family)
MTKIILTDYDAIQSDLQAYVEQVVEARSLTGGMSIGIMLSDGHVITASTGYAEVETQKSYTAQTPILICGITKVFTSVMVLQLVEEGRLSLDDTLDHWLPGQPNAHQITLQMLLSHTAGFKDYMNNPRFQFQHAYTPIELIQLANELGFNELKRGYYTTTNHIVLAFILEKVTDRSWVEELHTRIINPLKLRYTYYVGEPGVMDTILSPIYGKDGSNLQRIGISPSIAWSSGGIVSNMPDLFTFFKALLKGRLFKTQSMLSQVMNNPCIKAEPDTSINAFASFGLCLNQFHVDGITFLGHYGAFGYYSHMLYDPEIDLFYIDTSNSMAAQFVKFENAKNIDQYIRQLK